MSGYFRLCHVKSDLMMSFYVKLGLVMSAYIRICQVMPGKERIGQVIFRLKHVISGFARLV